MRIAAVVTLLLATHLGAATVSGRITECLGPPLVGAFVVKAYEELTFGIAEPGQPCETQTIPARVRGTAATEADGSYSITFLPTRDDPRACLFQTRVLIRVFRADGTLVHTSLKKLLRDPLEIDAEICQDACPLSMQGPAVVQGDRGSTVSFDVTVFLGGPEGSSPGAAASAWQFEVSATGATITGARHDGTDTEQAETSRVHVDPENPFAPLECRNGPVAASVVIMGFNGSASLPLGNGPRPVLKVTLQAVLPTEPFPLGPKKTCRVFFNLPCVSFGAKCTRGSPGDIEDDPITIAHELEIELRATGVLAPSFRRADANASGAVDISDAIATFEYLFLVLDKPPPCLEAADSNGDGVVDISDGVTTLGYLFAGGRSIPEPGPTACGPGGGSRTGCAAYDRC